MNVERTILEALRLVHPRLMATGTLWSEVRIELGEAVTYSGFREAVEALERKGQVVVVDGEDRRRVKITADGLARLAE